MPLLRPGAMNAPLLLTPSMAVAAPVRAHVVDGLSAGIDTVAARHPAIRFELERMAGELGYDDLR